MKNPIGGCLSRRMFAGVLGGLLSWLAADSAAGAEHMVAMRDNFFSPRNLTIGIGDTVQWVNQGAAPHTATSNTGLWDSGVLNSGGSFSRAFPDLGTFPYFCEIHGQAMSGTITVSEGGGEPERELYLLSISATCVTTNATGRVRNERLSTRQILEECAAENLLSARGLVLVYNLEADAFEAINRTNGSTVCTVATLSGGVSFAAQDGTRRERQAFLFWEDSEQANGSVVGTERSTRGRFSFRGSFFLGLQAHEDEGEVAPPKVCKGSFTTGRRFIP